MGYHSAMALELAERPFYDREEMRGHGLRREFLERRLEELRSFLRDLDALRPHDLLHPLHDRFFCSDIRRNYLQEPETVQDLLCAIAELEDLLWAADREEVQARQTDINHLSEEIAGQTLMVAYWDFAFLFREAQTYRKALPLLRAG